MVERYLNRSSIRLLVSHGPIESRPLKMTFYN